LNPQIAFLLTRILSFIVNDVILTKDEVQGLAANLLVSHEAPTGHTKLSAWLKQNSETLGRDYLSELKRHYF
jgi:NADH dehydrogenase